MLPLFVAPEADPRGGPRSGPGGPADSLPDDATCTLTVRLACSSAALGGLLIAAEAIEAGVADGSMVLPRAPPVLFPPRPADAQLLRQAMALEAGEAATQQQDMQQMAQMAQMQDMQQMQQMQQMGGQAAVQAQMEALHAQEYDAVITRQMQQQQQVAEAYGNGSASLRGPMSLRAGRASVRGYDGGGDPGGPFAWCDVTAPPPSLLGLPPFNPWMDGFDIVSSCLGSLGCTPPLHPPPAFLAVHRRRAVPPGQRDALEGRREGLHARLRPRWRAVRGPRRFARCADHLSELRLRRPVPPARGGRRGRRRRGGRGDGRARHAFQWCAGGVIVCVWSERPSFAFAGPIDPSSTLVLRIDSLESHSHAVQVRPLPFPSLYGRDPSALPSPPILERR